MDIQGAIHLAVMEPDLAEMEHNLNTLLGAKGSSSPVASASARPRLACSCAPELLVFDDLSSALDVETERTLWERVFALWM